MKYFNLLLLLLISCSANAQTSSTCTPTVALAKCYTNDAKDMALERMFSIKSPDTVLIEIPQRWTDSMLSLIAAVHNLGTQYEADSIFNNYCVHRWPKQPWQPTSIRLKVDTSYSWAKQWSRGKKNSGNAAIDAFLNMHGVSVIGYDSIFASEYLNNWAVLKASYPINFRAFADSIKKFPGALYYRFNSNIGDGDHIFFSSDTAWHIRLIAGWGDCPAGCTGWKDWHYSIFLKDCSVINDTIVRYDTHTGPYMPNCYLMPASVLPTHVFEKMLLSVFPNPANDLIKISSLEEGINFQICDVTGRLQSEGDYTRKGINISQLLPGIYTIVINGDDGIAAGKFIKQ